jgi:hypothetical protein
MSTVSNENVQATVSAILTEDVLTIKDARKEVYEATGWPVDRVTIYRWCLKGVGGIKLDHIKLGDRILTSRQAINRFIVARSR